MDIFIEYMVKRKKKATDYVKIFGTLILGLALIFVVSVVFAMVPYITSLVLLAIAGVIYLMYYFITAVNVEYEYILTNMEIDIDAIINTKRRKRLTTVNLRSAEYFGKKSDGEFKRYSEDKGLKKIYACRDANDPETCYIVYFENDDKKMLLFDPNEKILEKVKLYIPKRSF